MSIEFRNLAQLTVSICAWLLIPSIAVSQHFHGVIQLGIVIEDGTVAVSLTAPLSDVIGFEHEPENEDQIKVAEQAAVLLTDANAMFALPEAAQCEASEVSVDGPQYIRLPVAGEGEHHSDHIDSHHSHDDEPSHDGHSDIVASYQWTCEDARALDSLELRFADEFANIETVEIQIITATGTQLISEEGRVTSIPLSRQ